MSVPPRPAPDAEPTHEPDGGGTDVGPGAGADPESGEWENEDTEPQQILSPYSAGLGWGASWAGVAHADDSGDRRDPGAGFDRLETRHRYQRSVLGDVDLPRLSESFNFPMPYSGRTGGNRARMAVPGLAALAVLAVVGGLIFWLGTKSSSSLESDTAAETIAASTTTATPEESRRDAEAETRLMRMLPPGYPPGSCKPVDPVPGAVAMIDCAKNADPGGPTSATYLLARDKVALDASFNEAIRADAIVICPGNIQSPGPWRRNATPQQISGTLVCGVQGNVPTVAWTDEERMLVSIVRSEPPGPSLDQLYQWWSSHS